MQNNRNKLIEWFHTYAGSFIMESEEYQQNIVLKKDHTLRVCDEIVYIAENLGLSENEILLAEIIALLHDAGRFEQYKKFKTFADARSVNHAELGVEIIKENGLLGGFDHETENIILKSILFHNRANLPEYEDERVLFYSKLIRDADKLDIWKVVLEYYYRTDESSNPSIELDLPDSPGISPEVYETLINHSIVNMNHVKNVNDFKLLQAGWVFDINFHPAFKRIIEREYIPLLRNTLPDSDEINSVFLEIEEYLKIILNCSVKR